MWIVRQIRLRAASVRAKARWAQLVSHFWRFVRRLQRLWAAIGRFLQGRSGPFCAALASRTSEVGAGQGNPEQTAERMWPDPSRSPGRDGPDEPRFESKVRAAGGSAPRSNRETADYIGGPSPGTGRKSNVVGIKGVGKLAVLKGIRP